MDLWTTNCEKPIKIHRKLNKFYLPISCYRLETIFQRDACRLFHHCDIWRVLPRCTQLQHQQSHRPNNRATKRNIFAQCCSAEIHESKLDIGCFCRYIHTAIHKDCHIVFEHLSSMCIVQKYTLNNNHQILEWKAKRFSYLKNIK